MLFVKLVAKVVVTTVSMAVSAELMLDAVTDDVSQSSGRYWPYPIMAGVHVNAAMVTRMTHKRFIMNPAFTCLAKNYYA